MPHPPPHQIGAPSVEFNLHFIFLGPPFITVKHPARYLSGSNPLGSANPLRTRIRTKPLKTSACYGVTAQNSPSHAYHTYFIARLRVVLDVEVHAGKEHAAKHGLAGLWALWTRLPPARRPALVRGDCAYGQERLLVESEARQQAYLFRLRQTPKVKSLITWLEQQGGWEPAGGEWEARWNGSTKRIPPMSIACW